MDQGSRGEVLYMATNRFPSRRAAAGQIACTCYGLARAGWTVRLYSKRHEADRADLLAYYGLPDCERLVLEPYDRMPVCGISMAQGSLFHLFLRRLARRRVDRSVLYFRSVRLARHMLRLRSWHPLPWVFESHLNLDGVDGGPLQRRFDERLALQQPLLERADGLVFLYGSTMQRLETMLPLADARSSAWHGTDHLRVEPAPFERRAGAVYLGQLYASKRIEVLLDALRLAPGIMLTFVGGSSTRDRERAEAQARERGVADRVRFTGHLPHQQAMAALAEARVAVTLAEGIKLSEYMRSGAAVVAPRTPPVEDLFAHEKTALLYELFDAESLAAALRRLQQDEALCRRLGKAARERSMELTWEARGRRIATVLESCTRAGYSAETSISALTTPSR